MLVVETIEKIRLDHLVRGVPIKKLTRDLRVFANDDGDRQFVKVLAAVQEDGDEEGTQNGMSSGSAGSDAAGTGIPPLDGEVPSPMVPAGLSRNWTLQPGAKMILRTDPSPRRPSATCESGARPRRRPSSMFRTCAASMKSA